jgi:hypothetical protein
MSSQLDCLRNLEFGWSVPKSSLRHLVTGLADSGQGTSGGHATRSVADQTPVSFVDQIPSQDDRNTTPLHNPKPGNNLKAVWLNDRKKMGEQNTIDGS